MNGLLDMQGSFIVGGILMLNLLGLNLTLSQTSREFVSGQVSQLAADELTTVLQNDFRKIGYGVSGQDAIKTLDSSRIVFLGDVDGDGIVEEIQYSLSDTITVLQTPNSRDRYLYRIIDGSAPVGVTLGVVNFRLAGSDAHGNPTMTPRDIHTLEFLLEIEPTELSARGLAYGGCFRRGRVSPFALQHP